MNVAAFDRCIASGGVAVFPSDTVYGLATDPESEAGVRRLYELKRRSSDMPSAVMFFTLESAMAALPQLGPRTRKALELLLPGSLTLLVDNPSHLYPLACGPEPERLGVRVPELEALSGVGRPVLQSSANLHGGPDPRRLDDVPTEIRDAADVVLDGGDLPGIASTVVDLSRYEADGGYEVLRVGAVSTADLESALVPWPA